MAETIYKVWPSHGSGNYVLVPYDRWYIKKHRLADKITGYKQLHTHSHIFREYSFVVDMFCRGLLEEFLRYKIIFLLLFIYVISNQNLQLFYKLMC
jgi:hypothetical protein